MKDGLKFAHIAKLSHNIGEGALVNGLRYGLVAQSQKPISFVDLDRKDFQSIAGEEFKENSVSKRLDADFFGKLNEQVDALVIGGGGIIQTGQYDNFGGLCVAGNLDELGSLKRPIFLYALGDNRLKSSYDFNYSNGLRQLSDIVVDNGGLCSLRNDGSFERISDIVNDAGFMDNFHVIPDPGLFVDVVSSQHPLINPNVCNIVLQLAGDRFNERLSGDKVDISVDDFLKSLADTIYRLAKNFPINVIMAPHIPIDFHIVSRFMEICGAYVIGNSSMLREIIQVNLMTKGYSAAPSFFSLYKQCDLAIGMRGHSAICSVGLDTPFIGLSSHEKVIGFMKNMNLEDYSINVTDPRLSESLYNLAFALIDNSSDWKGKRAKSFAREYKRRKEFNEKLLSRM